MANSMLALVLGAFAVLVLGIGLFVLVRRWRDVPARSGARPLFPPARLGLVLDNDLLELLARGQQIQAIRRVRKLTGMGQKEAQDYVEALSSAPPLGEPMPSPDEQALKLEVEQEARRLPDERGKVEAIKRVRQLTGMGLKEAKDYVDSL